MTKIRRIEFHIGHGKMDTYELGRVEPNFNGAVVEVISEVFHPVTEEFECVEIYANGRVAARVRGLPYVAYIKS